MLMGANNLYQIEMYVNGVLRNTYPGSTTSIILDSLRDFGPNTTLELRGSNSTGSAWASATTTRRVETPWNQEGMHVRYYRTNPYSGQISADDAYFQRSLTLLVTLTDYSVPSDGPRNGRVFHDSVEDVLGWNSFYPSIAWVSTYLMSSVRWQNFFEEYPCNAAFPGWGYGNSSALCADPEEFSYDTATSGTAQIPANGVSMSDTGYPTYFSPASITTTPY